MNFIGIHSIEELLKIAERTQTQEPEGEKPSGQTSGPGSFGESKLEHAIVPMPETKIKNPVPGKTPKDSIDTETKSQPFKSNPVDGDKGNYGETMLYNMKAPQDKEIVLPYKAKSYWIGEQ